MKKKNSNVPLEDLKCWKRHNFEMFLAHLILCRRLRAGQISCETNHNLYNLALKTRSMERIGVTGAAGYIGSRVCYELKDTYDIVPVDNFYGGQVKEIDGIKIINADIQNLKTMEKLLNVDVVIHLAAISGVDECTPDPHLAYHVNVMGTETIGLICRKNSIPLIFPSSVAVLGNPTYFPIDENHPRTPVNWYGKTKKAACDALRVISEGSFPAYEFFMSNVFGVHSLSNTVVSRPNVISIFLDTAKRNEKLTVYRPGTQARNFLHVKDAARSYVLGVKSILEEDPEYKEFCIAGKESMTIIELAKIVSKKAEERGYNTEIIYTKNPRNETLVDRFDMNISKAEAELSFTPYLTVVHEIEESFKIKQ
ncbi:MAG: hypothetical protein AYK18_16885 [Theionarchaea archaeon DG-70]|nr:MAG: hypothetical protein AYK18_16885 [Theionarchaea archaeon DG-70]